MHGLNNPDDKWPVFGKVSLILEGLIFFSIYSSKVVIHEISRWFPRASIHSDVQEIVLLLSGVLSFMFGYLADDVFGKYKLLLMIYGISNIAPILSFVAIYMPLNEQVKGTVFVTSVYLWSLVFAGEAVRVALISEQFQLPQSLRSLKLFYFFFFVCRYAGAGVASVLIKVEQHFGGYTLQLTIRIGLLAVSILTYTICLILMKHVIRQKRVHVGVVDSVVACIASALYNRAFLRKKMPANAKWIDYSDAKYFKETKDSAEQLIQMSLIFLPFSLFFGLNEFLDVIWLEQNEWIDASAFYFPVLTSVSIISFYHAFDVLFLPLFEYLIEFVAPKRCNILFTDLQLIGSAIFLLGLTYLSTTILNASIQNDNVIRNPQSASIRFFSGVSENLTVNTPYSPTVKMISGDSFEIQNIKPSDVTKPKSIKLPVKITHWKRRITEEYVPVESKIGHTSSYLISNDSIIQYEMLEDEPNSNPVLDLVSGIETNIRMHIHLRSLTTSQDDHHNSVSEETKKFIDGGTIVVPTIPHIKRVQLSNKGLWEVTLRVPKQSAIIRNISLTPRSINTLFVFYNEQNRITFSTGSSNTAQMVSVWYAIPQIVLRSLADGIGKIATYYFTYTQSPRKLRATAFGVLFFSQYSFPGIVGILATVWRLETTAFILSIYTYLVFISLVLFIFFSLKYEEI